jgi:DNA (cytosine-5)-methyltransferase 1
VNYYNENDPKTAAWLRELIRADIISAGDVDERSIVDVKPYELTRYTQQHFFAGIGGWPLALRLAGWPDNQPVRTGSCPCQPFSQSGKQLGTKDERHLWPVFRDLITFGDATITFGEQVASPLGREWLAGIRADLEGLGYEVGAADLCAAGLGAPHIRQRLYWVAHTNQRRRNSRRGKESQGKERQSGNGESEQRGGTNGLVLANGAGRNAGQPTCATTRHRSPAESASGADRMGNSNGAGSQGRNERILECDYQWPPGTTNLVVCCEDGKARRFEPGAFPLADGIPHRVGLLRGYGNAIVPQLAAEFIQAARDSFR